MRNTQWQYSGDVNMLDYGGKNMRHIGRRQYQFIELINMDEACGRDNEGQPKYVVELRLVDLDGIGEATLQSALNCCGMSAAESGNPTDEVMAMCCDDYGAHAPLGTFKGNNAHKLLRDVRREANSLLDTAALDERLNQPVNKIGSSAREFMAGDFVSAMQRGCEAGSPDARIMAKMYGASQGAIDDARPEDFLPYLMGYMAAMNGGSKETDPDTSPEYFRGYERGERVKAGTCVAPGWITQQTA